MFAVWCLLPASAQLLPAPAGDPPIGGREATIELTVRRFFCDNAACARKTFVEQVTGLTSRYGRRTAPAHRLVSGGVRAGRPGRRALLGPARHPDRRMTLMRLIRALPEPSRHADGARRRRLRATPWHVYGTVLIDMHHPPPDRPAARPRAGDRSPPGCGTPRRRGDLPRPGRRLRRRRPQGRTRRDPGRRPVAPVAQPRRRRREGRRAPPRRLRRTVPARPSRQLAADRQPNRTEPPMPRRDADWPRAPASATQRPRPAARGACRVSAISRRPRLGPQHGPPLRRRRPVWTTCWSTPTPAAPHHRRATGPTCTNAGTRAAPTPPSCTHEIRQLGYTGSDQTVAATCARSAPPTTAPAPTAPPKVRHVPAGS